jgi:hypothetical protein
MKQRSLMKNLVSLVEAYDEFDWEILMKSFKSNFRESDRYNSPEVYEDFSEEQLVNELERLESHGR